MSKNSLLSSLKMSVVSIFLACTIFVFFSTAHIGIVSTTPSYAASASASINTIHAVTGVNGNPWGYNFVRGLTIKKVPATFCKYFHCIANFAKGKGYVMECRDATYSLSGGISGSCSHHKGNWRVLYRH